MRKWVLIVDDEQAIAWALAESLREDGLETEIAHSVAEAEDQLERRSFDFLITDVRLPDRSGLELLHELKQRSALPPTIIVSTLDGRELEATVAELGAVAYYQKPFALESLKQTVSTAIGATRSPHPTT